MRLPETWRELALIFLTATIAGFTLALTYPLLTIALERAGTDPLVIGINSAAGGAGIFLIGPFIERIVGRFGPVRCFQVALLVCAACMVLFAVWVDPWYWLPIRLLYGCGAAMMFVLSEAAVNGLTPDAQRGRVLGIYATLFCVGYAGGPLVLTLVGTEGALPFVAAALLFLAGQVPTLWLRAIENRLRPEPTAERRNVLVGTWRAAPLAMGCVLVYAFVEGAHFALLPVWAIGVGASAAGAAAIVGIWLSGNVVFQMPLGWLADRFDRRQVIASCCLIGVLALALMPVAAATPAALWPVLVVSGGVIGGLYMLGLVQVGQRFQGSELTAANTAFVMNFQIGMIAGPPLAGAAIQLLGSSGFPAVLAPPLVALGCLALAQRRRRAPALRPTT